MSFFSAIWQFFYPRAALISLAILCSNTLHAACPDAESTLNLACPELYAQLDRHGFVDALNLAPETRSDAQTVAQLNAYLAAAQAPQPRNVALDAPTLDQIVAENYRAAKRKEPSFLERLANWWNSLWGEDEKNGANFDFWRRFIPTETFARALFYGLSGLLAALIFVYGWRELQPFLALRRNVAQPSKARPGNAPAPWPPILVGLSSRSVVAHAYASLVAHLTARKRLPDVVGLTHAELAQAFADATMPTERAQAFRAISNTAAQTLFTEQTISPEELAHFLATANAVVANTVAANTFATTNLGAPNA